ncbi:MAG: DUF1415 domain-containing protein [Gammaproteobacteria bacterium]|nr:DUF1415 domain-containing protein [Gammaproteobacteria bacterium]
MHSEIEKTKQWLEQIVIGHNFCPFAKPEYDSGQVNFVLSDTVKIEDALEALIRACEQLDEKAEIETTLIVYANLCKDFEAFLDFVELANRLLEMQGYEGVYQLANFHPDYCFEGEPENDAANYTNRSPYPMLHLIREHSLEKALSSYPQPEQIPRNNIRLAREKGFEYFKSILNNIKKSE